SILSALRPTPYMGHSRSTRRHGFSHTGRGPGPCKAKHGDALRTPAGTAQVRRNETTRAGKRRGRDCRSGKVRPKTPTGRYADCRVNRKLKKGKRRRSDSNRCIKVLQTSPLPLGYGAITPDGCHYN